MKKLPLIGLHVSAAGGVRETPARAVETGSEVFQFFSRSPRGGTPPPLKKEEIKVFRQQVRRHRLTAYIHTPYYINLASLERRIFWGSVHVVRDELQRGSLLGVKYVVTHLGSAKDMKGKSRRAMENAALRRVVRGLREVFRVEKKLTTRLLIEIAAGAGMIIGSNFEQLRYVLRALGRPDVGVCLDTCHLFASGYDLRSPAALQNTMNQFRRIIGLRHFKLAHANDSAGQLGEHRDRHAHIGEGQIGQDGFRAILQHPDWRRVNFVVETPHDSKEKKDVAILKTLRK
jgi:deoxyribonuclease-4